jgi:hypothetical protein
MFGLTTGAPGQRWDPTSEVAPVLAAAQERVRRAAVLAREARQARAYQEATSALLDRERRAVLADGGVPIR